MNEILTYLAAANLLICLVTGVQMVLGNRTVRNLKAVPPLDDRPLPKVSVIVAARNEERHIEQGLESLVNLDYDNLEITVVNDRSTDGTGEILDRMANDHPQLKVVHVTELPAGWLGKNHALYCGATQADGEYLLFTDADVVMEPSTLRRALRYALENEVDHLPMFFRVAMPNWLLESFVITFSIYLLAWLRPWKAKDPNSSAHVGAGGFNLIRAEVYRKMGTHEAIRMRPDDDVKLGKLVKKHGFRQDFLIATEHMYVPWYGSVRELILGLEKNVFAGAGYSVTLTVGSSLLVLAFHVLPFVAVLVTTGLARWLYAGVVAVLLLICLNVAYHGKARLSCCFGFPVGALMFVYIQWRTMLVNLFSGGIRWRDTHYPLAELKANKV